MGAIFCPLTPILHKPLHMRVEDYETYFEIVYCKIFHQENMGDNFRSQCACSSSKIKCIFQKVHSSQDFAKNWDWTHSFST